MCSVHNQRRGPSDVFMQQTHFGLVYVCKPEGQCRGNNSAGALPLPAVAYQPYQSITSLAPPSAGASRGPLRAPDTKPRQMCVIHQKPRLLRYLELEDGEYRCHRDHECDSGGQPTSARPQLTELAAERAEPVMCTLHGKRRRADKVQLDPATNTYVCIAEIPCT